MPNDHSSENLGHTALPTEPKPSPRSIGSSLRRCFRAGSLSAAALVSIVVVRALFFGFPSETWLAILAAGTAGFVAALVGALFIRFLARFGYLGSVLTGVFSVWVYLLLVVWLIGEWKQFVNEWPFALGYGTFLG